MPLLLDTHIWVWFMQDDKSLSLANKALLEKPPAGGIAVSAISVWEIAMLMHRGRLTLHQSPRAWIEASLAFMEARIIPIDAAVALESYALPEGFHGDPADRMIVATARQHGLTLITQDKAILTWAKKGHVMTVK
jgi:PIN domain nuclease of toxin-antitoxin system